jgi:hypothetical protein
MNFKDLSNKEKLEATVDFCIGKCGEGYCSAMTGKGGYPCLEYICFTCDLKEEQKVGEDKCAFCRGGILE